MKDLNRMLSSLDRWGLPLTLLICLICCTLQTSAARKGSTVADTLSQTAPAPTGTSARSVSPTPMLPAPSQEVLGDTLARTGMADTLRVDSSLLTRKIRFLPKHSPAKATLMSAVLPGLGQLYNKKYWKIPIIYGGFAAFGYFIGWNNRNFKTARQAYSDLTDTIPSTDSYMKLKQIIYYDLSKPSDVASLKQGLTSSQDYYRRNRDLLIIVTAAFYGLNIIDASVDAHFFNFDISDDLSLNWEPVMRQAKNQNIFCLNCTLRF